MAFFNNVALINLFGWTIGFALYAMLLVMSVRSFGAVGQRRTGMLFRARPSGNEPIGGSFNSLPLATALLGLVWNAGAIATHSLQDLGLDSIGVWPFLFLGAASYAALGFLPAVVVHSATGNLSIDANERSARLLTLAAYSLSGIAAVMHFTRAYATGDLPSTPALYILTAGFAILMIGLFRLTRGETSGRRAVWAAALAVFAVSALHLSTAGAHGNSGTGGERWYTELVGHHASLPLALAILYQDYRFAFADIFLKRALGLLALVALIAAGFNFYVSSFAAPGTGIIRLDAHSLGVLLVLWSGTALAYPALQRAAEWFVDKIVLRRVDYAALRAEVARHVQIHESAAELLDDICRRLQPALTARDVSWREASEDQSTSTASPSLNLPPASTDNEAPRPIVSLDSRRRTPHRSATVLVPTTDTPHYELTIGELAGGRRLLSDDIAMLEWTAVTVARRIDALRVTHERCEQVQREQQIAKLATEAQLRALRAQINPHFLFNALTTIGYLIQTSPARALETLLRLTDLLRRVLRAGEEWTTLGEELKLVESYLDIERARFEERLRVRFDVPGELLELQVPSLIVQPLVENAIKHGISPRKEGGEICVAARLENQTLIISVRDTGAGTGRMSLAEGRRHGVGLANVEQRLRLCCGGDGQLRFESAPEAGATAELRVPALHKRVAETSLSETRKVG